MTTPTHLAPSVHSVQQLPRQVTLPVREGTSHSSDSDSPERTNTLKRVCTTRLVAVTHRQPFVLGSLQRISLRDPVFHNSVKLTVSDLKSSKSMFVSFVTDLCSASSTTSPETRTANTYTVYTLSLQYKYHT